MALADEIPRVLHAGNDTLGPFPLAVDGTPITYADSSEIVITRFDSDLVPTLQVEGVHYTLSADSVLPNVGEEVQTVTEAEFTFESDQDPLAEGEFVLAERITVPTQDLILAQGGGLSSATLERTFDVLMRHIQELRWIMARAVLISRLDPDTGYLELPVVADRAGKLFGFDDDGNPVADSIEGFTQGDPGTDGADGSDGAPGSQIYLGVGTPSDATGVNGDVYINTGGAGVGDIYDKAGGTWGVATGNIRGAAGAGSGDMLRANNLSDLINAATARTNLGLNSAALLASSALFQVANNLSEGNATTMRTNLGLSAIALMAEATVAQFLAGTASKALTAEKVWDAAAMVTLTDSGGAIAVDMGAGVNFEITLDGNHAFSAPSNTKVGRSGVIYITQDGTGNRVPTWHANYKWADATAGVLSTTAGYVDRVNYFIRSSTFIELSLGARHIG